MNLDQLKAKFPNHELRAQHPYYMGDAIYDIPGCLEACLEPRLLQALKPGLQKMKPEHIFVVGCGTSYNSCQAVAYGCKKVLGIPCEAYDAYDFTLDVPVGVDPHALVISISQSGSTLTTCWAQDKARSLGATTVAITGKPDSRLAQTAAVAVTDPYLLEIPFGKTRSYLSTVLQGLLAGVTTAGDAALDGFVLQAHAMVQALRENMDYWEKKGSEIALDWAKFTTHYMTTGFGMQKANADEIGLKIIEVVGESVTCFSLEEFTHGPSAAFRKDMGIILFQTDDRTLDRALQISNGIAMSKADLVVFTDQQNAAWSPRARTIRLPEVKNPQVFGLFPAAVAAQFLMYYLAIHKGMNPDINGHDVNPELGDIYEFFFPPGTH